MKNRQQLQHYSKPALLGLAISMALLSGCSNDSNGDTDTDTPTLATQKAIVATVASDYSAGAHATIDTTAPYAVEQNLVGTISDITVNAFGSNFYRIERFNGDSVTRFDVAAPASPAAQFSTLDEGEAGTSNPQALIFESDSKAYLMRYGKTKAWIVNPLASTQAEFKTGEIDLSEYDPGDGSVEMVDGVISDGKLFVIMQRFDTNFVAQDAYVAVVDTATNLEIDTETNALNKGILLPVKNPNDIQLDDNGEIYISAAGNAYSSPPEYTGGIVTLDSASYAVEMLVDDGDAENHPVENITDVEIVSAEKGYLISYKGWTDTSLYAFNPTTGLVDATPLEGMSGVNLSGLATDTDNRLWVSISSSAAPARAAGIRIYNTTDNSLAEDEIAITLDPKAIVFANTSD